MTGVMGTGQDSQWVVASLAWCGESTRVRQPHLIADAWVLDFPVTRKILWCLPKIQLLDDTTVYAI